MSLLGGLAIPPGGFGIILRQTLALGTKASQLDLALGQSLLRRLAKPVHGLAGICGPAKARFANDAQVVLRFDVALLRRWSEPFRRLREILHHPLPCGVDEAEVDLSLYIAPFGGFAKPLGGFGGI